MHWIRKPYKHPPTLSPGNTQDITIHHSNILKNEQLQQHSHTHTSIYIRYVKNFTGRNHTIAINASDNAPTTRDVIENTPAATVVDERE